MTNASSPKAIAAALTDYWSPRVVGEVDDSYIKVAKVHGSLCWHSHDDEDELFLILQGHLRIELEHAAAVELDEGEMFVVRNGVRQIPVAVLECLLMLIERMSTLHTGNVVTEQTRSLAEQLGSG
jgi:mannose-6-phosphate isomerase-like protein (cupin superfamily)